MVYAGLPHVLIRGILAPSQRLITPKWEDLDADFARSDSVCRIEHVSGGGRPDRVFLAPTFSHDNPTLRGGEGFVFIRSWAGSEKASVEINQRLLHALELHFVEERNAYCRVDELGDIEDVVKIVDIPSDKRLESIRVVAIKAKDLCEYACLARMGLIFYFDFTRYLSGSFNRWPNPESVRYADTYLYYQGGIQDGSGSFVNGQFIFLPRVTKCDIVRR